MNIRITNAFEGLPAGVKSVPQRLGRLDARTRFAGAAIIVAVLLLVGYLLWHWFGSGGSKSPPPPVVVVATAISKNVTVFEHAIGTVVAESTVQVTAQVTGQLLKADFQEGQIVHAGDLLFEIDPRPFEAALEQTRAQLAKDSAQLVSAQNDQKRYDSLFAQNAISSQQHDQADANAKALAATVASDRAAVQVATLNLGYTKIRSPIDGKTGPILIQPGNLVSANGSNPLVVITQIEPVKVSFSLPQTDLPRIQERERAHTLSALLDTHETGGTPLSAPVDFVSNQVSAQTGTIELRATFDNHDHRLVPGQMVDVDVTLANLRAATVIPREGVNDGPNGRYVFVVSSDGQANMRPVKVLFDDGTNMAVSGVKPGQKIIVDGQLRVVPGIKVRMVKPSGSGLHTEPINAL
jgi:membrane fusion protein, multidrug efflux system